MNSIGMLIFMRLYRSYFWRFVRRNPIIFTTVICLGIILSYCTIESAKDKVYRQRLLLGHFDYQPATFLKGKQPGNESFCEFNYGFPHTLNWSQTIIDATPELGDLSNYRVIYNVIQGTAYSNCSSDQAVTYATHSTPEFLYHIVEIAKYWEGPISLAVYVPNYDLALAMQILNHLCHCYEGMSKVSVHLVYPIIHKPTLNISDNDEEVSTKVPTTTIDHKELLQKKIHRYKSLDNETRANYVHWVQENKANRIMQVIQPKPLKADRINFKDCSGFESFSIKTYRQDHSMIYPINVARNVAKNASWTNYFLVSDIELVPSDGLASKFLAMVRFLMGDKRRRDKGFTFPKTVFVVPLFEVERGENIPRDKDKLVRLLYENRASYFHQKICSHCQRFPGLQTWMERPAPKGLEPILVQRREYPYHRWEPLYFGTRNDPWYNEGLSWEGRQDKMTQMLEICLQRYHMVILDGGFLTHAAVPKPLNLTTSAKVTNARRINARRYIKIIAGLKKKYKDIPQCKVK